jgi:DNA-directed RNA polymerase subunit RPC12/RpoP
MARACQNCGGAVQVLDEDEVAVFVECPECGRRGMR